MYVSTDPSEILFVTDSDGTVPAIFDATGDERSVSRVVWEERQSAFPEELPNCVLLSDRLETETVIEISRTLRQTSPTVPVVAFVGDDPDSIDSLFEAGVTEVIRSTVAAAPQSLVDRRIEAALSLAGRSGESKSVTAHEEAPTQLGREVTENINDVVWINNVDEDGIQYVNSAYEDVWGRPREPLYEDRSVLLDTVHPDDRERVRQAMERQLDEPEEYDVTYRIVRPDGDHRWVHSRAVGVREDGVLVRIVGVATDVTERKNNQKQLAAERDLVERILEASPVGITVMDTEGTIVRANDQAGTILGIPRSELEGELYHLDRTHVCNMEREQLEDEEFPFNRIKATGEPVRNKQYIVDHPGSETEETIIAVDGVPLFDDGSLECVVITFDDVTEQVDRESRLQEQRDELAELDHINRIIRGVHQTLLSTRPRDEILQAVCDNLTATDQYRDAVALQLVGDDRLEATAWTDGAGGLAEQFAGEPKPEQESNPARRALDSNETQVFQHVGARENEEAWRSQLQDADIQSYATIPVVYEENRYGVIAVFSGEDERFGSRKRAVLDELGETVGHAIAGVESRQREETLTALYQATERFLTAESPQEVSEVAVDTAMEVLDLPGIGIFLFDDETNLLSPVAGTETFLDFFGESPVFGPGKEDSITWNTYVTGETQCFTDVHESDRLAKPDTSARSSLLIPLGEHGVFVAASTEVGIFSEQKRQLVGLLAATTEAALDRVAGQADIRERDAALEERAEQLDRTEQVLSVSQDITALIRDAMTRTEIEDGLCDQLVEHDCLAFAWVGQRSAEATELKPRTWAGDEDGYLDAISLGLEGDEPALRTATNGETTTVPNVTTHIREQAWAREAIDRGFQSVLAVPLAYGDTDYGVVVIYSTEPGTFADIDELVIDEFGSTIAYGINSVETRRGILAEQVTELDIYLGQTNTFLNAVAATVGGPVSYHEMAPLDDQTTQILFSLSDPPVEEVLALESQFVSVNSLTHTQRGGTDLFRATISGETVATELLDCGGIPEEVTATPTETRATVQLSAELSGREFLDRLRDHYPDAELRSKHDNGAVSHKGREIHRALDEQLTDRQREVLMSAYESGFFQSPRETTGEELAALLDISQPTVTHHLREAQHRLFSALFEDR
jgi:PAS domain S-box-containing protein